MSNIYQVCGRVLVHFEDIFLKTSSTHLPEHYFEKYFTLNGSHTQEGGPHNLLCKTNFCFLQLKDFLSKRRNIYLCLFICKQLLKLGLPVKCLNIAAVLIQKVESFSFWRKIKCFFKLYLNLNLTLKLNEHKTKLNYHHLTTVYFLKPKTAFTDILKGREAWSSFFWFIAWFVCLNIHLHAASLLAKLRANGQIVPERLGQKKLGKWNQASKKYWEVWSNCDLIMICALNETKQIIIIIWII